MCLPTPPAISWNNNSSRIQYSPNSRSPQLSTSRTSHSVWCSSLSSSVNSTIRIICRICRHVWAMIIGSRRVARKRTRRGKARHILWAVVIIRPLSSSQSNKWCWTRWTPPVSNNIVWLKRDLYRRTKIKTNPSSVISSETRSSKNWEMYNLGKTAKTWVVPSWMKTKKLSMTKNSYSITSRWWCRIMGPTRTNIKIRREGWRCSTMVVNNSEVSWLTIIIITTSKIHRYFRLKLLLAPTARHMSISYSPGPGRIFLYLIFSCCKLLKEGCIWSAPMAFAS